MAVINGTEKKSSENVDTLRNRSLLLCKIVILSGCRLRISHIMNWRMFVTRFIPVLCITLVWLLMLSSRYHVKQETQKSTVQTREYKIVKNHEIMARVIKYKAHLLKETSDLKSQSQRKMVTLEKPDGEQNRLAHLTKANDTFRQRKLRKLQRIEKVRLAQKVEQDKQIAYTNKLVNDLKKQNIPSIETFRKNLSNAIYGSRIASIIKEASSFGPPTEGGQNSESPSTVTIKAGSDSLADNTTSQIVGKTIVSQTESSKAVRQLQSSRSTEGFMEGSNTTNTYNYTLCNAIPPMLLGRVFVDFNHTHNMTRKDVLRQHPDLKFGGMWRPPNCVARHRVAIIIPYRDREQHLVTLLSHLLPILKRQELNFRIFVTEQTGNDTFNKARIMNAAFKEAIKLYDFQCFVFHDVDLIPEDDRNMYSCPVQPRHMSVAIDEMDYKVPYDYLVGGVLSMRTEHFQMVNGYSNLYWGWGAEDDDLAFRIIHVGLKITRPPSKVARYKMIKHEKRTPTDWRKRSRLLRTGVRRFNFDGLNSVNYKLISIKNTPLFTHVLVDIGKPPSLT